MKECVIILKSLKQENDFSIDNVNSKITALNELKDKASNENEAVLIEMFISCLKYFTGDLRAILTVNKEIKVWFCNEFNVKP